MPKQGELTEKELVAGCIRNDRFAQEVLYRRFFASMIRMCMRYTQDREEAMEIVNMGMLRVFKKLHTFAFKGSLEGWIRRLVFHALSDHFRKKGKPVPFPSLEEIAERSKISVVTSKRHLAMARKQLKQLIQEHYKSNHYAG